MAASTPARARALLARLALHARLDALFIARGFREAIAWYVADTLIGIASVTAVFLLAQRFDGIGTWSKRDVIFMLGFAMLARGLVELFFGYNVAFISRRIGRGQLDHLLVQPAPLWLSLATEGFAPATGLGLALPGALVLAWGIAAQGVAPGPLWWLALVANLIAAAAILLAFAFAWGSLAFWAPRGAEEINSQTMRMMDQLRVFPLDGVGTLLQSGLLFAVPAGFVAWIPARALLGHAPLAGAVLSPVAALVVCAVALFVFRRGLAQYARNGSTRYLDWGHRR